MHNCTRPFSSSPNFPASLFQPARFFPTQPEFSGVTFSTSPIFFPFSPNFPASLFQPAQFFPLSLNFSVCIFHSVLLHSSNLPPLNRSDQEVHLLSSNLLYPQPPTPLARHADIYLIYFMQAPPGAIIRLWRH